MNNYLISVFENVANNQFNHLVMSNYNFIYL